MAKRRVMLKLSGEALAGDKHFGFDDDTIRGVAKQVKAAVDEGVQIAIVIGGGNFWRGRQSKEVDRYKADQVGILATIMNCIYVSELFRIEGMKTKVMSSIEIGDMAELFNKDKAVKAMQKGTVIFCAGGTGHPYFSTDTGVVLRALELECDEILLAKAIDGVYDSDPKTNPKAKKYSELPISEVVNKRLGVIDLSASAICMENKMPLLVFSLEEKDGIVNALEGEDERYEDHGVSIVKKEESEMDDQFTIYIEKMHKTHDNLMEELAAIRAGRANPHVLDKIMVDYYGVPTPVQQVGNVSVPEARIISIQPWDKSMLKPIEKAINMSDLGINPINDGTVVRLVFPELTEERRKQLTKEVKKKGEEAKVAIRNIRRDAMDLAKKLEKSSEITEDDLKRQTKDIQDLTDHMCDKIDKSVEAKNKELMTV